ncbi:unnamed protein product [Victoria cruziana]
MQKENPFSHLRSRLPRDREAADYLSEGKEFAVAYVNREDNKLHYLINRGATDCRSCRRASASGRETSPVPSSFRVILHSRCELWSCVGCTCWSSCAYR